LAVVVFIVLGALFGVAVTAIMLRGTDSDSRSALIVGAASTTTRDLLTTTSRSPTTTRPVTTTAMPATTATTVLAPRGTLQTLGPPQYGQSFPSGPCANWRLLFRNNSNTEVVEITFAPPSGEYSNFAEFDPRTQQHAPPIPAAPPQAAVLNVSLPPYGEQVLEFQTCTSTPPPGNPNYQYGATAPQSVAFRWVTGHAATAPFL
jgi:hypothetical protein